MEYIAELEVNKMTIVNVKEGKILIVDDNLANTKLLEKILKIAGYKNMLTTNDSRKVISLYQEYEPDIILLDLKMPYMDGLEVMRQLYELEDVSKDYLPVIVITAQNDQLNMKKAFELGARDFIGKPFNHDEILLRIKNTLEVRLLHKQVLHHNEILEDTVHERTKELKNYKWSSFND